MNRIIWIIIPMLTTLTLGLQAQKIELNDSPNIEEQWLKGLLLGKDMSNFSGSYAKQIQTSKSTNKTIRTIRRNNYLENFTNRYNSYANDVAKLNTQDKQARAKNWENKVTYLKQSYFLAKKSQTQLLRHLKKKKRFLQDKKAPENKLQLVESIIEMTRQKLTTNTELLLGNKTINKFKKIEQWDDFLEQQQKKFKNLSVNKEKSTVVKSNLKILRASSLPYAGRNYSAPQLQFTPEIIPSYANQTPAMPTSSDLIEDEIVSFSNEIRSLADDLGHEYIKIYNYVRQNIQLEYYAGAQKGADASLHSLAGNDVDQAALLIALLRASNIPARFVHGVIQQPIEEVTKSLGLTNANTVIKALNRAGIAHEPVLEGGQVTAINRQYTWVSAYIPYANYRGSVGDLSNKTWIPLAPAIKNNSVDVSNYNYQESGVQMNELVIDYLSTSNNQSPIIYWQNLVQTDINNNYTDIEYSDLLNRNLNATALYQLLPSSLPFEVIVTTQESAVLDSEYIQTLTLQMGESNEYLDVKILLPKIAGKRLTLSYLPATVDDLNIINQAGGMSLVAPYLVDLRPVIKVDGKAIQAINSPLPMASFVDLKITFTGLSNNETFIRNTLIGNYLTLVVSTQNDSFLLDSEQAYLFGQETASTRIMHNLGKHYNQKWNEAESELANVMDVALIKAIPSLSILSLEYQLLESQGLITQLKFKGISIDAVTKSVDAISRKSASEAVYDFFRLSSLQGSYLESDIFQSQWAVDAISADKGIRILTQIQPILQLTPNGYQAQLAATSHPQYIKDEIGSWLNQGYHAILTSSDDIIDSWTGSSWHIYHPETGHSGYFISGIYAGGQTTQGPSDWDNQVLNGELQNPYGEGPNEDPLSAASIEIIESTNNQVGVVNTELPSPLMVRVKDLYNNPVKGASVTFKVKYGDVILVEGANTGQTITAVTDEKGTAKVTVFLDEKISLSVLAIINLTDANKSLIGQTFVSAEVDMHEGVINSDEVFNVFALPDVAANIFNTCGGPLCSGATSGPQGTESTNMHFIVVDKFQNPVSNVPIVISSSASSLKHLKNTEQIIGDNPIAASNSGATGNKTNSSIKTGINNHSINQKNAINCVIFTSGDNDLDYPWESDMLGPYSPVYSSAKIALHKDCETDSLTAPACAVSTVNTISNFTWEAFSVYTPIGVDPFLTSTLKLSSNGLPDATKDLSPKRWLADENINDENLPYICLKVLYDLHEHVIHRGSTNWGPYGLWEAGKPGETITVPRVIYNFSTYIENSNYYIAKLKEVFYYYYGAITEFLISNEIVISPSENNENELTILIEPDVNYDQFTHKLSSTPSLTTSYFDIIYNRPLSLIEERKVTTFHMSDAVWTADIAMIQSEASNVQLNDDFELTSPIELIAQSYPDNYHPKNVILKIFKNNTLVEQLNTKFPAGDIHYVLFKPNEPIDPVASYQVEAIMNLGTEFEIKSERVAITGIGINSGNQKIVNSVKSGNTGGIIINGRIPKTLLYKTELHLNDGLVCREGEFLLELKVEADIIIQLDKLNEFGASTGLLTTLADGQYPIGTSSFDVSSVDPGSYIVHISANATASDDQEDIYGSFVSTINNYDSLSISHPVVKGVDLATGSMIYSKKALSISAPGPDLDFIYTYSNQSNKEIGPLGYGWSHNYMSRVIQADCNIIIVTGADGGSAKFRKVGGNIVPMRGYHSTLELNNDGSYSFYSKNGTHYHYKKHQDKIWWNDYIQDPNGNRLSIELEPVFGVEPIIKSVTDSVGRQLIYSYDLKPFSCNQFGCDTKKRVISSIQAPENRQLKFEYTSAGQLESVETCTAGLCELKESYQYLSTPTPLSIDYQANLLSEVLENSTNAKRTYNYDDVVQSYTVAGWPAGTSVIAKKIRLITEDDGGTSAFSFSNNGGNFNSTAIVNQNTSITTYTINSYGAADNIATINGSKSMQWEISDEILLMSETDENGRTKSFEYDQFANLTKETIGQISRSYTYKPPQSTVPFIKDRIATYSNWRDKITTFNYDAKGNKIKETLDGISTEYTYNPQGLVRIIKDGRNNTQLLGYDIYGSLVSQIDALNNITSMTWDSLGRKLSETDANGNQTIFEYDNSNRIIKKTLLGNMANLRVWNYSYVAGGTIKTETDPNGNATEYRYDKMGRLTNINNARGDNFSYLYDNNGNKLSENDFKGNITAFSYDTINRLETKTEPEGKVTNYTYDNVGNVLTETTADRIATYSYDPKRYFLTSFTGDGAAQSGAKSISKNADLRAVTTRTVDPEGNILTETDPNGNLTTFTYDAFNRLLTESGPMGSGRILSYDANGNILREITSNSTISQSREYNYNSINRKVFYINATQQITDYVYDANGNVMSQSMPQGKETSYEYNNLNLVTRKVETGSPSATWNYEYDLTGNLTREIWPNGNIINTVYDVLNRPVNKSDTTGVVSSFTYDANSNIDTETDGNGNTTSYLYNGLNQRISATKPLSRSHSYSYTGFGEMLTDTGPNGTLTYEVNTLGQRVLATGPDGYNEVYGYDVNDNLLSFTDSRGTQTTYSVNALNQTESQTTNTFNKTFGYDTIGNKLSETDYRGITSDYSYDPENRQTSLTRAGQLQQTTTYDSAGLAQTITDANGNGTVHQYNAQYYRIQTNLPETQLIKYTPNAFGDVEFQNNPGLNDITRVFDQRRRLTSETNGAGDQTSYEYDLNNNRTAVIKPDGTRWEYGFDQANRLTTITNTVENITTSYGYSNKDNLTSITDAMGKQTTFTFDNRNRKLSKIYADGQDVNYSYDENGNLKTVDLPNGTGIVYGYDILNRQISKDYTGTQGTIGVNFTVDGNGNITNVLENIDGTNSSISASFDNFDRIISITDHHGNSLQYSYDANGNRKLLNDPKNTQSTYTFDDLNRLSTAVMVGTGSFDYVYNTAGLMSEITYPNNGNITFAYDNANRIDVITAKQSGATVATYDYQYDANGNRLSVVQNNQNGSETISYSYDKADRLTQVVYPDVTVDYSLDKVGNRLSETIDNGTPITKTYSYNNRDQLTGIVGTNGLNITYSFDNAGNQTQMNRDGAITSFDYDARQRVKTITQNSLPIHYKYDYLGNRIEKQGNGQTTLFTYDGTSLLYETNTIGNVLAKYHYGSDRVLAETRNSQNSYIFHDALRTPIAITNQDGSIQNRRDYDVFGNLKSQASTSDFPYGYTGYRFDEDTGLYYAKARYYSPEEGRFIRNDPLEGNVQDPPSLHRYLYANANPNSFIDPTGEGNDTAHYYDGLLIGSLVGLNEHQAAAFALGAQIADEFKQTDAVMTSSNQNAGNYWSRVKNNCGNHALCNVPPVYLRNTVANYVLTEANNYLEIGTADHAFTDSYFHIDKDDINDLENQILLTPIIGHLFELKDTDKAYLYHSSKRVRAFRARAWLMYEHTVKQGSQKLNESDFADELDEAVKALDKQHSKLLSNHRKLSYVEGGVYTWVTDLDEITDEEEFNMVRDMLSGKGLGNIPKTENHGLGENVNELLNDYTVDQLIGVIMETNKSLSEDDLRKFGKDDLIQYLNGKLFQAQAKSRDFIYAGITKEKAKAEIIKENNNAPGIKEISK